MSFTRQPCPVWLFVDLDGNILDDNYYAFFLQNTIPYLPQPVYQDPDGTTPWANPLQFYANGTLPENLYFETGLTYRIEIRRGNTQADPLIYLIENFIPGGGDNPDDFTIQTNNQITNPEFALVSFTNDYAIVNTGTNTYEIAPGWFLILSGSATMTLSQITMTGNQNFPGNPSFGLNFSISSGSFTSVKLYQRFDEMPAIWANQYISVNFLGRSNDATREVSVVYTPSNGTPITVINDDLIEGFFRVIAGAVFVGASISTNDGTNGYVDLVFNLPNQGDYDITNIQALGTNQAIQLPYEQTTVERQKDYTFHYYRDSILHQPKDNLLTGWNFSLNPWQFYSTTHGAVAANEYTADQTIIVQQAYVTSATANNVSVSQSGVANNRAYDVAPLTNANKFAIIQYIAPQTIKQYWSKIVSSMVSVLFSSPTHSTTVRLKMRLIYRSSLPPAVAQDEPISVWTNVAGSDPTFKAGWTAIVPLNDPIYTLNNTYQQLEFNHFVLPECVGDDMTLGIVIYTLDNMNPAATSDSMLFQDVSLVNNDFAIKASTETFDETLRKCQFYYEKSYAPASLPGAITSANMSIIRANTPYNGIQSRLFSATFSLPYKQAKRASPTLRIYSNTSGALGSISGEIVRDAGNPAPAAGTNPQDFSIAAASGWTTSINQVTTTFSAKDTQNSRMSVLAGVEGDEALFTFHYVIDSRLGV